MTKLLRRPSLWIALALALALLAVLAVRARGPEVRTVTPAVRDLEQHVVASGRVRVPTRIQIAAQTPGLVVAVAAVEGQRVAAGDLLVQLDDAEARSAVAQAKAAVDQAMARVEQLRKVGAIVASESLAQSASDLARAESDLTRAEALGASGAIPAVELEDARRAVDVARARKNAAEAQQIAAAPLGADSRVALTALRQAQAQLAGAEVRLRHATIVAPAAGEVLTRSVEPGDVVQPARTLLVVAADAPDELVFQADERNLAWIGVGQTARASADAYPQEVFDAEVGYVAPSIDPQRGSVEVRLRVPRPPPFLKPDMTVSIDLTVATRQDVLTLPAEVVRGAATPTPWVLVAVDGRVERRVIGLGIRGEGSVEITTGLAPDAAVVVPDGTPLTEGARVRATGG